MEDTVESMTERPFSVLLAVECADPYSERSVDLYRKETLRQRMKTEDNEGNARTRCKDKRNSKDEVNRLSITRRPGAHDN